MTIEPIKGNADAVYATDPRATRADYAPDFYAASTFRITEPERGLWWLRAARADNLAHVRKLSLVVEAFYAAAPRPSDAASASASPAMPLPFWEPAPTAPAWYALLEAARERLPGLRELEVYLHAETTGYHQDVPRLGAGDDVRFARGLARLGAAGLERLALDGFFAREWPVFLEGALGRGAAAAAGDGRSVWTAEGKTAKYLRLLDRYQGYCPPCDFGS